MKNLIYNPWSFSLFVIFAIMFGLSLKVTGKKAQTATSQLRQLESDTKILESRIASKSALASKSAQPFTKEKITRDELLLIKPGEIIIELPPIVLKTTDISIKPSQTPLEKWQEILR